MISNKRRNAFSVLEVRNFDENLSIALIFSRIAITFLFSSLLLFLLLNFAKCKIIVYACIRGF